MSRFKELPSFEYLNECFKVVDSELVWKDRPSTHFTSTTIQKRFNTKHSGRKVGTVDSRGYLRTTISVDGSSFRALNHRILFKMYNSINPKFIDHRDGNRLNNTKENLISVTDEENARNRATPHTNKSGIKGVSWSKKCSKWRAEVRHKGKTHYLGLFKDKEKAGKMVQDKYKELGFTSRHGGGS